MGGKKKKSSEGSVPSAEFEQNAKELEKMAEELKAQEQASLISGRHDNDAIAYEDDDIQIDNDDSEDGDLIPNPKGKPRKKSDPKKPKELSSESKQLIQEVKQTEERLKAREQIKLTISKIDISKLIKVHRFTANQPWIKCSYGNNYHWIADYSGKGDGLKASWINLKWSFNLERNVADRQDLVFSICSKDVVIGKYIVTKEDLAEIPESNSGFFAIQGDIINGLGKAGGISILCQRGVADRPTAANRSPTQTQLQQTTFSPVASPAKQSPLRIQDVLQEPSITTPHLDEENVNGSPTIQAKLRMSQVSVRILSIALMDLKSVHLLEANSPSVCVEAGEWKGLTETLRSAGIAARWNNMMWKFVVFRDQGMVVTVYSNTTVIGKVFFSTEELLIAEPNDKNIVQVIKHISNGKELTGKIKFNMIVNHPNDVFDILPVTQNIQTAFEESNVMETSIAEGSVNMQNLGVNAVRNIRLPFAIIVQEITVLDMSIPLLQKMIGTSKVKLHCACGSWAGSTSDIKTDGRFAHWIDVKWSIPVMAENSSLRVTLWSQGVSIGLAALSVVELLGMPTDMSGRTEIFTKIFNKQKEISGKVRLICRYEQRNVPSHSTILAGNSAILASPSINRGPTPPQTTTSAILDEGMDEMKVGSKGLEDFDVEPSPEKRIPETPILQFPLLITIDTISLLDLISVHALLKKNSPQVRITCDRKSAVTPVLASAGSVGRWNDLKWVLKVRADSNLLIEVASNNVLIGKAHLSPHELINVPISPSGSTEIAKQLKKGQSSSGKITLQLTIKSYERGDYTKAKQKIGNQLFLDEDSASVLPDGVIGGLFTNGSVALGSQLDQQSVAENHFPSNATHNTMYDRNLELSRNARSLPHMPWHEPGPPEALSQHSHPPHHHMSAGHGMQQPPFQSIAHHPQQIQHYPLHSQSQPNFYGSNIFLPEHHHHLDQRSYSPTQPQGNTDTSIIFDPRMLAAKDAAGHNFQFKVTIDELDVWDLTPVHTLSKNSPSVSAACGKWNAISSIQPQAGAACYWTDLKWNFRVRDQQTKLRLTVHSKTLVIGTTHFTMEEMIVSKADEKGLKRVSGNILAPETRKPMGKIKIAYHFEVERKQLPNEPRTKTNVDNSTLYDLTHPNMMHHLHLQQQQHHHHHQHGLQQRSYSPTNPNASMLQDASYISRNSMPAGRANVPMQQMQMQQMQMQQMQQMQMQMQQPHMMRPGSPGEGIHFPPELFDEDPVDTFTAGEQHAQVLLPCSFTLHSLSTMELTPVSAFKKNTPAIKVFCDNFYQITEVFKDTSAEVAVFDGLDWSFPVGRESVLKVTAVSHGYDIGTAEISILQLTDLPIVPNYKYRSPLKKNKSKKSKKHHQQAPDDAYSHVEIEGEAEVRIYHSMRELIVPLKKNGVTEGKITIRGFFTALEEEYHDEEALRVSRKHATASATQDISFINNHENRSFHEDDQMYQRIQSASVPGGFGTPMRAASPNPTTYMADPGATPMNHLANTFGSAPATPQVASQRLLPQQQQQQQMQMPSQLSISPSITTTQSLMHQMQLGSTPAPTFPQVQNVPGSVRSVADPNQSVKSNPQVTPLNLPVPFHFHQQNKLLQQQEMYLQQRNSMANDGDSVSLPSIFNANGIAAVGPGASVMSASKKSNGPHSSIFMPDLVEGPLKVKILAISVVELPSVHTFSSNSPCCSIACGKYSAGTTERESGGNNASWDQLDFTFNFDKSATLRALVTSRDKTIGFVNMGRVKLINGKKSKNGPMVIYNELQGTNGKPAGKFKMVYEIPDLMSQQAAHLPFASLSEHTPSVIST